MQPMASPRRTLCSAVRLQTARSRSDAAGNWSYAQRGLPRDGQLHGVGHRRRRELETQVIAITVTQVNDAGTFGGDLAATTGEDTPTSGTATFADTADGFTAPNFVLSGAATNGTATIDAAGNWTYTPRGLPRQRQLYGVGHRRRRQLRKRS